MKLISLPLPGPLLGVSLWRLIVVKRGQEKNRVLIAHEIVHSTKHWRRYGLSFPFRYVFQWLAVGCRYRKMPFEVEAYRLQHHPYYLKMADELISA